MGRILLLVLFAVVHDGCAAPHDETSKRKRDSTNRFETDLPSVCGQFTNLEHSLVHDAALVPTGDASERGPRY